MELVSQKIEDLKRLGFDVNKKPDYVALYAFEREKASELSLAANDLLWVNKDVAAGNWLFAVNFRTKECGYVPKNHVERIGDWFFPSTSRDEAERILSHIENEEGTFLVRQSECEPTWTLSVLCLDSNNTRHALHFGIYLKPDQGFYLTEKSIFRTLEELIRHYQSNMSSSGFILEILCSHLLGLEFLLIGCDGKTLGVVLKNPCSRTVSNGSTNAYPEGDHGKVIAANPRHKLGEGNFGTVMEGTYCGVKCAIKILRISQEVSTENEAVIDNFLNEIQALAKLYHPHILRLLCVCTISTPLYICTELMVNGGLDQYLLRSRTDGSSALTADILIDMAEQLASAMRYMELSGWVHRDLAARNVLVGRNNLVKFSGLGSARSVDSMGRYFLAPSECNKIPIRWSAPELLASHSPCHTHKSDIWSFGILLWEIASLGEIPYGDRAHNRDIVQLITTKKSKLANPSEFLCSERTYLLMLMCWESKPELRPSFREIHKYICEYMMAGGKP